MKWPILIFTLAIGALLGNAGHGDGPPLIDSLAGMPRTGVLLLLGLVLFGALWHFGSTIGRYHTSGDPKQVHYIDEQTGERIDHMSTTSTKTVRE